MNCYLCFCILIIFKFLCIKYKQKIIEIKNDFHFVSTFTQNINAKVFPEVMQLLPRIKASYTITEVFHLPICMMSESFLISPLVRRAELLGYRICIVGNTDTPEIHIIYKMSGQHKDY